MLINHESLQRCKQQCAEPAPLGLGLIEQPPAKHHISKERLCQVGRVLAVPPHPPNAGVDRRPIAACQGLQRLAMIRVILILKRSDQRPARRGELRMGFEGAHAKYLPPTAPIDPVYSIAALYRAQTAKFPPSPAMPDRHVRIFGGPNTGPHTGQGSER